MNRQNALSLAVFTLFAFPLIGMLIVNLFSDQSISIMIRQTEPVYIQLAWGLGVGAAMGFACLFVSTREFMLKSPKVKQLQLLFRDLKLSVFDCILISVAVGFGEELLFRGAIQPFWGIWLTSGVFVAIHGYINYKDWRISVYGILMTIFIVILGYMTEHIGIWSAAAAHAMIDFILLVNIDSDQELVEYPLWEDEEE